MTDYEKALCPLTNKLECYKHEGRFYYHESDVSMMTGLGVNIIYFFALGWESLRGNRGSERMIIVGTDECGTSIYAYSSMIVISIISNSDKHMSTFHELGEIFFQEWFRHMNNGLQNSV